MPQGRISQAERARRAVQSELAVSVPKRPRGRPPKVVLVTKTPEQASEMLNPTPRPSPFTDGGASSVAPESEGPQEDTPDIGPAPKVERPDKAPRGERVTSGDKAVLAFLMQGYTYIGIGLMLRNQYDGTLVLMNAQPCAESVLAVAKQHPALMRTLKLLAKRSVYMLLVAAHTPVVVGMLANHGVVSPQIAVALKAPEPPPHEPRQPKQPAAAHVAGARARSFIDNWRRASSPVTPQYQPDGMPSDAPIMPTPNGATPDVLGTPSEGAVDPSWMPIERE